MWLKKKVAFIAIISLGIFSYGTILVYNNTLVQSRYSANRQLSLTAVETSSCAPLISSCQKQFNDEFNIPIGTDHPMPISVFHKGNKLTIISSIENYQNGQAENKKLNYTSLQISNAKNWFMSKTWKIEYTLKNGQTANSNCKPFTQFQAIPNAVVAICEIDSSHLTK